ncbi:hypothetical protein KBD61_02285 [Patescibacteria group bacterium]|nr:hypothetical protein [Patescibacteria group bacterium]
MPPLSELPGEINRAKFLNALVPLPRQSLKYILKQIEVCSGVTWEDVKKHL